MPAVCRFYLKGYCRYGKNCRFEHPGEQTGFQDNTLSVTSNFSFATALSDIVPNNPLLNRDTTSGVEGFSFTRALQTTGQDFSFNAHDVDMSEGFVTNRQDNLGGLFSPIYNNLQQQQFQHQQSQFADSIIQNQFQPQFSITQQQTPLQTSQNSNQALGPTLVNQIQQQQQQQTFLQQTVEDSDYSNLGDLSEAELRAFQSDKFDFRKIPIRPPPKALCQ